MATSSNADNFVGKAWLQSLGYAHVDEPPMAGEVDAWWGWYTSTADWYVVAEEDDSGRSYKVQRISIQPASMVCEDWASLVLNEKAVIGAGDASANEWLQKWIATTDFLTYGNRNVERAMALGTAAWALRIEDANDDGSANGSARIVPQRFDARHIFPISFDEDTCTECAFRSRVTVGGRELTEMQVYRRDPASGTYAIELAFFNSMGGRVETPAGYAEHFDTKLDIPPFSLIRPGLDNHYWEFSPFGVSVFDRALGSVLLVDEAVDNTHRDLHLGQKMVFIPADMLETDSDGVVHVPREKDQQLFKRTEGNTVGVEPKITEYNPDLRVDQNKMAFELAMSILGKRVGFGWDYYSPTRAGGLKTAKEVASDNAELMQNVNKHRTSMQPGITGICEAAIGLACTVQGMSFPEAVPVTIDFDDSIIEDSATEAERMRADMAAGVLPRYRYAMQRYGLSEEEARKMVDEASSEQATATAASPFGME